jgi:hypothetical protein
MPTNSDPVVRSIACAQKYDRKGQAALLLQADATSADDHPV